jgi:hypothetical protein
MNLCCLKSEYLHCCFDYIHITPTWAVSRNWRAFLRCSPYHYPLQNCIFSQAHISSKNRDNRRIGSKCRLYCSPLWLKTLCFLLSRNSIWCPTLDPVSPRTTSNPEDAKNQSVQTAGHRKSSCFIRSHFYLILSLGTNSYLAWLANQIW